MATYDMTRLTGADSVIGLGDAGTVKAVSCSYDLATALALNDVIRSPELPAGATVFEVLVVATDLDTNGTPAITLDVGYGGDVDYFIDGSTVGQAGGVASASAATAKPLVLAEKDTIDILVSTAPATGATSGSVSMTVLFLPPNS